MANEAEIARLQERIDSLETRIAFQDQTIEDLNTAVTDLWKQLEDASRHLARLGAQVREIEESALFPQQPEPPPPHY